MHNSSYVKSKHKSV
jgi:hypothetical protein